MAQRVRLLDRADIVFEALRALGPGWHTRKDIAAQLGLKVFGDYNVAVLDVLIASKRIIAEQRPISGPIPVRWEYRINEDKAE